AHCSFVLDMSRANFPLHVFHTNLLLYFPCDCHPRDLRSFPTRRSSDLDPAALPPPPPAPPPCSELPPFPDLDDPATAPPLPPDRSEEHTSELQSRENLVCRLLLEKKNQVGTVLAS